MYLCRFGRWSSYNNAGRVRYGETRVEASRITEEETCNKYDIYTGLLALLIVKEYIQADCASLHNCAANNLLWFYDYGCAVCYYHVHVFIYFV